MFNSYKQHMPSRLSPSETRSVVLESVVTTTPIFFPQMCFKNIETVSTFRVRIIRTLDLGLSDDPLENGSYESVIYNEVLDPGDFVVVPLNATIDDTLDTFEVELTNNGIVTSIIQCWLEGVVDSASSILAPTSIVI